MEPTTELYDSLKLAFSHFNGTLFDNELPDVIFTVQRQKGVMGYFAPDRWGNLKGEKCHEIAINPSFIAYSRLIEVMQTLVHEMVHCWQYVHGNPGRDSYHNKEWALKMISVGLMPSSTGEPGGQITGQQMGDYIIKEGPFLPAFNNLKDSKHFQLKWIDRKAVPRIFDPVIADPNDPTETDQNDSAGSLSSTIKLPQAVASEYGANEVTPYTLEKESEAYSDTMPSSFFVTQESKPQTRHRYVCKCVTRVYGKPGLEITCKKCGHDFEWVEYVNKNDP